jgi:hypothetical protein
MRICELLTYNNYPAISARSTLLRVYIVPVQDARKHIVYRIQAYHHISVLYVAHVIVVVIAAPASERHTSQRVSNRLLLKIEPLHAVIVSILAFVQVPTWFKIHNLQMT